MSGRVPRGIWDLPREYVEWCKQWCDCEGGGFLGPLQDDEYGLCEDICDEFCEEDEWIDEVNEEEW